MSYGNEIIKRLYDSAPYRVKTAFASLYGLSERYRRYGKNYHDQMAFLLQSQYWNEKELINYQYEKLFEFFEKIKGVFPYYLNKPEYSGLLKKDVNIHDLPILEKQKVRKQIRSFYTGNLRNVIWGHTSGTTGSAMIFPISKGAYQKEYAFRNLHYNWGGVSLHKREKVAICAGHPVTWYKRNKPPFWVYDLANNHLYCSSYHMSETSLPFYIKKLEEFNPSMIHGYPSSVYLLAIAYEKHKRKSLTLKSIYTSSETLLDFQRKKIQEVFQTKVFNWYGTSEMSANIIECEKGELHLKQEHSFIEILNDENQPCNPGETGRIVSTNFNNPAFPLIRYDLGDMVTISKNQKPLCGRGGLLIDSIEGRIEDYILTPEGRLIGRLDHLFKDTPNVLEAQIEQQKREEVILRIVRSPNYTLKDERLITKEAKMRLGDIIKISYKYVDEIPRTANGKFRFVVSGIL